MVILETPYVNITFREEIKVLLLCWLKKPTLAVLRDTYTQALAFVEAHPFIVRYCADQTLIGALTREQENWLMQEFYPTVYRRLEEGICAAIVLSEEHFNAIIMNYQATTLLPEQEFIQMNYFTELEEALSWLEEVKSGQDTALLPSPS